MFVALVAAAGGIYGCQFLLNLVSGFCEVRATFKSEADAMKFAALLQEPVEAEVPLRVPEESSIE